MSPRARLLPRRSSLEISIQLETIYFQIIYSYNLKCPKVATITNDNIANNSNMEDKYKLDNFLLLTALCPFHLPDYISKIGLNIFSSLINVFKPELFLCIQDSKWGW